MRAFLLALSTVTLLITVQPPHGHSEGLVTLDFEDLRHDDDEVRQHPRVYGGEVGRNPQEAFTADACALTPQCFLLAAHHFFPAGGTNAPRFVTSGTLRVDFPGSTALAHGITLGEIVLTRIDGGTFDLLSIDLAEIPPRDANGIVLSGPFSVTFYGIKHNGRVVTETATLVNASFGLERFAFPPRFTNLASVSWFQAENGVAHQFDNIVVSPR